MTAADEDLAALQVRKAQDPSRAAHFDPGPDAVAVACRLAQPDPQPIA